MDASENLVTGMIGLHSIDATPNACLSMHASTVHDQRLSECPKTPLTWEVLPYSFSIGLRSFSLILLSRVMIQLIPDVSSYRWLILIPYCMQGAFDRNVHLCIICQVRLIDLSMYHYEYAMDS